ncbi:MAG: hypothetical protein S4CHLAM45_05540 [Chlamydiales bacterium]|nr:hypothetical protein [Chlamydiales bacterium]MCH9619905.1 hypothetical protein [Chlamydiales bacterium]MCH9622668.1 hypothetical protein [Chlamydiales bacterium]
MRLESTLISLIALLLGTLLFFTGLFLVIPFFQLNLVSYLGGHLVSLGVLLIFFSMILLSCFTLLCKRRYLLVKMGGVSIQDRVFAEVARMSIAPFFPGKEVNCRSVIHGKRKVEILANLPYVKIEEQEMTLEKIEKTLALTLARRCGLTSEFLLNVSFQEKIPTA